MSPIAKWRLVTRLLGLPRMVENVAMLHHSLLQRAPPENHCVLMAASLKLLPGSTVRWRGRRYLIVDYQSLDRHHRATAGQAQTRTYPRQRSSTRLCVPNRFRPDTGPCVGSGGGLANSGKEIRDSKAAPQHGERGTNRRSCQKGCSCFG